MMRTFVSGSAVVALLLLVSLSSCGAPCPAGTVGPDGRCLRCGDGTIELDGACIPAIVTGPVSCGSGTREVAGRCVMDGSRTCGAGTTQMGDLCVVVPAARYDVRVPLPELPGDGWSKVPVLAIGRTKDGALSSESVVYTLSRPTAGTLSPATAALGPLGAVSTFTPCASTAASCLGPFEISIALASEPKTPIASTGTLHVVPPAGVASLAPCLVGGNLLHVTGDAKDFIHPGEATFNQGDWATQSTPVERPTTVRLALNTLTRGVWNLSFSTERLDEALAPGIFEDAERTPFAGAGRPGLEVSVDQRVCDTLKGRYQIHTLTMQDGRVSRFAATFQQHCEGAAAALRGCVVVERP